MRQAFEDHKFQPTSKHSVAKIWKIQLPKILRQVTRLFFARHAILLEINKKQTVLDLGCANGNDTEWYKKMGFTNRIIGLDIHRPYLREGLKKNVYDKLICASATHLPFREKAFDSVLFLQAIEHLTEKCGWQAINECERVGAQVIVTTPVGFVSQKSYDNNIFQKHLSGWTPKSMKKHGFKVHGFAGIGICWVEEGAPVLKGRLGMGCVLLLASITQPVVFLLPTFGFQMLCIKASP
jgi:ubiquinone/menaquinone biosynthesis C-methylase UbiE